MATKYADYYKRAMDRYAPQREADIAQTSAGLADKGLLASTGGQGALGDIRNKYYAAAAAEANQNAQWQSTFDEARQQAARNTALQWWDAINSLALSKKNAGYKDKSLYWANTPSWYKSYQTGPLKYGDGQGDVVEPQIGDGKGKAKQPSWVNYEAHQEDLGSSLAERQFNAQQDLAREQLDLERRRLDESIRQSRLAADKDKTDPWYEMMSYVNSTTQADKDPDAPGIQRAILPSEVLNTAEGTWGFDVLDMAKNGDEKAVAVIKLLYPKTWQQRLGMEGGATVAPAVAWSRNHLDSASDGFAESPGYALLSGPAGLIGGGLRSGIESLGSNTGFRRFFGQQPGRFDLPGQENWWSRLFGGR